MLLATLVLSVLIGVSLGLLGGGGSILTVPILVYVAGQDPKVAIATSLLVVAVTSAAGAVSHARAGRVRWRVGLVFGAAGMAGAYAGGRLGGSLPGDWLLIAFGIMMAVTAVAMLRGRRARDATDADHGHPTARIVLDGVVVGLVTGLVGAGGGFLVVPALTLLGGLPMHVAVGTSLVVIALKSVAGLAGYLQSVAIDWPLALGVTAAAIGGTLVGGRLAGRASQEVLRRGFGWFVIAMAAFVLGQQLPTDLRTALVTHPATWAGLAMLSLVAFEVVRRRRRRGRDSADSADPGHPEGGGTRDGAAEREGPEADAGGAPTASVPRRPPDAHERSAAP